MFPVRPLVRSGLRVPRLARPVRATHPQQLRFQSSSSSSSANNARTGSSHLGAGIAGGLAGAALLYAIHSFTPAGKVQRQINKAAKEADKTYQAAAQKLQQSTPSTEQAIDSIKHFTYAYVGWVPGGRAYVDTAFNDFETIRQNHRDEVDRIVSDAYKRLQDVAKSGLSLETASKAYDVLADLSSQIASLAGDAISDIIDNHPELKEKLGGNIDQLKQLGEQYGPEAKKQVDETWSQIKDIMAGGFSATSLEKARKVIEEKVQKVKKLGDEAWKRGLEQAKPFFEKNPKVKELVEKNADALKQGNAKELFDKVRSSVETGDMGGLEDYVSSAIEKAKSKGSQLAGGSGLEKYFEMIPDGSEILPKLQRLREVAEEHKDEGERLLKETVGELREVLEKKAKKAQDIVDKAKKVA